MAMMQQPARLQPTAPAKPMTPATKKAKDPTEEMLDRLYLTGPAPVVPNRNKNAYTGLSRVAK